ncbi:hypothetical protein ACLOJK_016997 [Asimina triloba]
MFIVSELYRFVSRSRGREGKSTFPCFDSDAEPNRSNIFRGPSRWSSNASPNRVHSLAFTKQRPHLPQTR